MLPPKLDKILKRHLSKETLTIGTDILAFESLAGAKHLFRKPEDVELKIPVSWNSLAKFIIEVIISHL